MSKTDFLIADDALFAELERLPEKEQRDYLFLAPHPNYPGRWYVDSIDSGFFFDFEEQIGKYRTVSPASLGTFLERADDLRYKVSFMEDPATILSAWDHLNDRPEFSLNSTMPGTINGMLPFQLQGFNYLRRTPKGGLAIWSTGTGKTALETALLKQHLEHEDFDLGLVVCKRNNKKDTQRKLLQLGSIDYAYIFDGTPKVRNELYAIFDDLLGAGERLIGICNYEKLREDTDQFIQLVTGRNVVVFWDEMPTKLSNRGSQLYGAVREVFYEGGNKIKWENRRPDTLRQYDLTATPIENSPVGVLNQVRLVDPDVWPSIKGWEKKYVATRNFFSKEPETFSDLEQMGLELEFMTHQVDKNDPDIAKLFPKVREEIVWVDWSPQDRRLYDKLVDIAAELAKAAKKDPNVKRLNPLSMINILQMICCAPSMVQKSADNRAEFETMLAEAVDEDEELDLQRFISGSEAALMLVEGLKKPITDDHCEKLDALRELVTVKHPTEKIVIFSTYANYIQPILGSRFEAWGVPYTVYRGTDKQRQEAKDQFRTNPDIRIFLSSDAGSDSIDLPEGSVAIEYDQSLKYATKTQRRNRIHRVNSAHESVIFYDLMYPDSVEERKRDIVARKQGYHETIFKGRNAEDAASARMTEDDLWFILGVNED